MVIDLPDNILCLILICCCWLTWIAKEKCYNLPFILAILDTMQGVLSAIVLSLVPMIRPFQWQSLLLPVSSVSFNRTGSIFSWWQCHIYLIICEPCFSGFTWKNARFSWCTSSIYCEFHFSWMFYKIYRCVIFVLCSFIALLYIGFADYYSNILNSFNPNILLCLGFCLS